MASSPSSAGTARYGPLIVLAVMLILWGLGNAMMFGVGCSENRHPGTDRTRVCDALLPTGGSAATVWLVVLAPAIVLLASQAGPVFRRHPLLAALGIFLATTAGWVVLHLFASGNIGDTTIGS